MFKSLALFVSSILLTFFVTTLCFSAISGSLDEKKIIERIKPIGEVTVEAGSNATASQTATQPVIADIGQHRYEETCKMCHETGLADAPKFGNKKDWEPRIAQGVDTLVQHALHGYKAMPAKGGCSTCSDDEIKKAVEYMVSKAK